MTDSVESVICSRCKVKLPLNQFHIKRTGNRYKTCTDCCDRDKKYRQSTKVTTDKMNKHIEALFHDGMNWDNQNKWRLDFIKDIAEPGITIDEFMDRLKYTNIKPVWI